MPFTVYERIVFLLQQPEYYIPLSRYWDAYLSVHQCETCW